MDYSLEIKTAEHLIGLAKAKHCHQLLMQPQKPLILWVKSFVSRGVFTGWKFSIRFTVVRVYCCP